MDLCSIQCLSLSKPEKMQPHAPDASQFATAWCSCSLQQGRSRRVQGTFIRFDHELLAISHANYMQDDLVVISPDKFDMESQGLQAPLV
jgi:hypothetical protein